MKSTSRAVFTLLAAVVVAVSACGEDAGGGPSGAGGGASGTGGGASGTGGGASSIPLAVNLGLAGDYAILAKTGIATVPTSAITGNLGVSPAAATFITGFSLTADATNVFSTSPQLIGKAYAADYTAPTPTNLTTAVADMLLAFTDAAGRVPGVTELGAGNIGGMTLAPGVYKWGTGVVIPTDVTLSGRATDVWIFQIAQDLAMASGTRIVLAGGALAKNVFWQVAGLVDLGTTAHVEGVILTQTSVTLRTGASINGRLLAQTAVNIDASTVVAPPR
jgi:Ice-binding-like